ncbi:MAG: PaaI family thioesterase [Nitrospiraceae bacterium]|nr:PaaI family thioesterase [Nitrospiraceae bacterium]
MKLLDDSYCFACGRENPGGLRLVFETGGRGVRTSFTPQKKHQGYKDIVHGGIITTLLDEAMAHAAIRKGFEPLTAEITVRFKNPLYTGEQADIEGWIEDEGKIPRRLIGAASEVKTSGGKLIATATSKLFLTGAADS